MAIVVGSGMGSIVGAARDRRTLPYHEIPGWPTPRVDGHGGALVAGVLDGVPVVFQSGRFHLYEGFDAGTVVAPVRLFGDLGIGVLIVTNAAGGLRPTLRPPGLMLIADQLNLTFRSPLWGAPVGPDQRFPDMSRAYDAGLRQAARAAARELGIALAEGVYAGVIGPGYETPAEIGMLRWLGADAVGMSTVTETIAARARGIRVLGISVITNLAAGMAGGRLSHADVVAAGASAAVELEVLVRRVVGSVGA